MQRFLRLVFLTAVLQAAFPVAAQPPVDVGSKAFTESVIVGRMLNQLIEAGGRDTVFHEQLGGSRILWNALRSGSIDVYPEYTGTLTEELLAEHSIDSRQELEAVLADYGVNMTAGLGFSNSYALGMRRAQAEALGIGTISDLAGHPQLRFGFSNEFMDREDGWPGLSRAYDLEPAAVTGLEHALAYRGIESGSIDVTDLYSTDPEIAYYDLRVLEDDRAFFPDYEAVVLYRDDLAQSAVDSLHRLVGRIDRGEMIRMNAAVQLDRRDDARVAAEYLADSLGVESDVAGEGLIERLQRNTRDHLLLVAVSLSLAILVAIPAGILATRLRSLEGPLLGVAGILQTVPSLALLVLMIPLFGIGALPAIVAMFLYSLLPIVRNTHSGLKQIPRSLKESARALGLPEGLILRRIELPLAMPSILAGIKTSAVMNVGVATLGALIGAGGYGQPILTGIRLDSIPLILEGAIPAALLALLVQGLFDLLERWLA